MQLTCANGRKRDRSVRVCHTHLECIFHSLVDFHWVRLSNDVDYLLAIEVAWLGHYHTCAGLDT